MKIFDPTFGVKSTSLMVAHMLNRFDSSEIFDGDSYKDSSFLFNCNIKTFHFYNGRERGIILEVSYSWEPDALFINFGEHRNSDNLFVQTTKKPTVFNQPDLEIFNDDDYNNRKFFDHNAVYEVTDYIKDLIKEYFFDKYNNIYLPKKAQKAKS